MAGMGLVCLNDSWGKSMDSLLYILIVVLVVLAILYLFQRMR